MHTGINPKYLVTGFQPGRYRLGEIHYGRLVIHKPTQKPLPSIRETLAHSMRSRYKEGNLKSVLCIPDQCIARMIIGSCF